MSRGTDKLSKRAEQNIRGAVSGIEKATKDSRGEIFGEVEPDYSDY